MKLRRYQYNSLSFVSIVDELDCPVSPYISCYLNGPLAAMSANTKFRYANELLFVLKHFAKLKKPIDLPERVASGKFITDKEYIQFFEACLLQKSAQDDAEVIAFPSVNDKHMRNIIAANQRGAKKVTNETSLGRLMRGRMFIEYLFRHFHGGQEIAEGTSNKYHKLISQMKLDEQSVGRNKRHDVANPEESVIPDDVFVRLLEMILPSSPNNPFKSSAIRNYLIISIFIQSGIRRGALGKLKVSDCHFYGSYDSLSIYALRNDPTDTRSEKANQKTKSHLAIIAPVLMEQIKFYIDHVRPRFPKSRTHDFVFVSEKNSKDTAGLPLSLKAINAMSQKLSKALGFHIHPHLLRHKWNEIFDKEGEEKGVNPTLLEDMRKYAMGWSHNSGMSQIYNEKRLAKKVRELSKAHQERVDRQK